MLYLGKPHYKLERLLPKFIPEGEKIPFLSGLYGFFFFNLIGLSEGAGFGVAIGEGLCSAPPLRGKTGAEVLRGRVFCGVIYITNFYFLNSRGSDTPT